MHDEFSHTTADAGRRRFLKRAALAGAALALPAPLRARARPPRARPPKVQAEPVRIGGRVVAGGQGISGVAVTDGRTVVRTGADGNFALPSSSGQPFVYLSVPAGYQIPQHEQGTARFYEPIRPDARGQMQVQFDLQPLRQSDENHAFFALADPQTLDEEEMRRFLEETALDVQQTAQTLDSQPLFGVTCGDITFDRPNLYPQYRQAVAQMGMPFFQVLGNHDMDYDGLTDEASAQTFRQAFGPAYYSFERGAVHYVVLDDVFWNRAGYFGYLDAAQLAWLEQDLARVEAGRPVVVFVHIPAQSTLPVRRDEGSSAPRFTITNRAALYALLEPYQAHIISGHTHENEHVFEGGVHEHVLGTACGAWWTGPVCYDGTPDGYGVYEVRGEDLRWRYKATGHDAEHQMRLYPRGTDPEAPDEFIANLWNWDPEWTVVWYEDGVRRGQMARRVGQDPLAADLYPGDKKPEKHPWVDPVPTGHLFYAPLPPEAGRLRVEATDRFGRTYRADLDPQTSSR